MDAILNGSFADSGLLDDGPGGLGSGLALLMDELAYGVIVANLDGKLLHANHAARHEISRLRVLGIQHNLLQTCSFEDGRALQDALIKVADGKRSLISFHGSDGASLTLAVLPLRGETGPSPTRAALLFARASVCESLMLCFFARNHGLTSAEEQVLNVLCQGFSAPEAARQLKVAVSTVRSHVRSLCAKTGSSGVRELVNQVAVLPPVAPLLMQERVH